jgi:DnaJ-class molecular chaperone
MEMIKRFTVDCWECEGHGKYTIGHPNDPSSQENDCLSCHGTGRVVVEDYYNDLAELLEDYPSAKEYEE